MIITLFVVLLVYLAGCLSGAIVILIAASAVSAACHKYDREYIKELGGGAS